MPHFKDRRAAVKALDTLNRIYGQSKQADCGKGIHRTEMEPIQSAEIAAFVGAWARTEGDLAGIAAGTSRENTSPTDTLTRTEYEAKQLRQIACALNDRAAGIEDTIERQYRPNAERYEARKAAGDPDNEGPQATLNLEGFYADHRGTFTPTCAPAALPPIPTAPPVLSTA